MDLVGFMGHWLKLCRLSNGPTVVSGAIAGTVITGLIVGAKADDMIASSCISSITLVMVYVFGMILNDVLDRKIDAQERPGRPIPSGNIPVAMAVVATVILVLLSLGIALSIGMQALVAVVVLISIVVLYDWLHAGWAGSALLMGLCRGMVYIVSAAFLVEYIDADIEPIRQDLVFATVGVAGILAAYVTMFTVLASREVVDAEERLACGNCDQLVGETAGGRCPECGRPLDPAGLVMPGAARRRLVLMSMGMPVLLLLGALFIGPALGQDQELSLNPWSIIMGVLTIVLLFGTCIAAAARYGSGRRPEAVMGWIAVISIYDAYLLALLTVPLGWVAALGCFALSRLAHSKIAGS
ncbi:MAG: hypothetical protein CMJ32_03775 [Phycisphaerae bacterium]|nr:hypothetical protein [Phycisphaerae bacterium]